MGRQNEQLRDRRPDVGDDSLGTINGSSRESTHGSAHGSPTGVRRLRRGSARRHHIPSGRGPITLARRERRGIERDFQAGSLPKVVSLLALLGGLPSTASAENTPPPPRSRGPNAALRPTRDPARGARRRGRHPQRRPVEIAKPGRRIDRHRRPHPDAAGAGRQFGHGHHRRRDRPQAAAVRRRRAARRARAGRGPLRRARTRSPASSSAGRTPAHARPDRRHRGQRPQQPQPRIRLLHPHRPTTSTASKSSAAPRAPSGAPTPWAASSTSSPSAAKARRTATSSPKAARTPPPAKGPASAGATSSSTTPFSSPATNSQSSPRPTPEFGNDEADGLLRHHSPPPASSAWNVSPQFNVDFIARFLQNHTHIDDFGGPGGDDPDRVLKGDRDLPPPPAAPAPARRLPGADLRLQLHLLQPPGHRHRLRPGSFDGGLLPVRLAERPAPRQSTTPPPSA